MTLQEKDLKNIGNYVLDRALNIDLLRNLNRAREKTLSPVWIPVRNQVWIPVRNQVWIQHHPLKSKLIKSQRIHRLQSQIINKTIDYDSPRKRFKEYWRSSHESSMGSSQESSLGSNHISSRESSLGGSNLVASLS